MAVALLSNVNMNFVIRKLGRQVQMYETEGYGNELGILMNPASSYYQAEVDTTFLVMDLMELLEHDLDLTAAETRIASWFASFAQAIQAGCSYYVSDAYLWGVELGAVWNIGTKAALEQLWQKQLDSCCQRFSNVHSLPYHAMIEKLGDENAFSLKMWYMGRILHSSEAQEALTGLLLHTIEVQKRTAKKVLLLDLDNTLWGGLAGEADHTPVALSEEHSGLAYKNLQRVILQMQRQGVILGIVSKNNEEDAMAILEKHPHMVLRPDCFSAKRINWGPKHDNIREIAEELNLGLDSFVFWDDNPSERQLVMELLPQVTVPQFPEKPEDLAPAMVEIYHNYFEKVSLTAEDLIKTAQYAQNAARKELEQSAGSFEDYLKQLNICLTRVDAGEHSDRLLQLLNKTNQFNLTAKRFDQAEIAKLLANQQGKRVFLYGVSDRFGDNGLVAAVLVDVSDSVPVVDNFVMSCRVMGKNIEYAVMSDVEASLRAEGFQRLQGIYLPTSRNKPVANLFDQLGYRRMERLPEGGERYEIDLSQIPHRVYDVAMGTV